MSVRPNNIQTYVSQTEHCTDICQPDRTLYIHLSAKPKTVQTYVSQTEHYTDICQPDRTLYNHLRETRNIKA